jgi:hypothetical protein
MTRTPFRPRLSLLIAALAIGASALPLAAASRAAADLSLVPADSSTVAVVRLSDLRDSPVAARLFADADRLTADGDAARFLEEAQLNPKKDVDVVVIATKGPPGRTGSPVLVTFEGRFDPDRLAAAAASRGVQRTATSAGDYYLVPENHGSHNGQPAAVAFVNSSLVIAGTESSVAQALADRQSGGTGFASGSGLGRELKRVDPGATMWALVDVRRYPSFARRSARGESSGEVSQEPAMAIVGAMKSVSLIAIQAKTVGDSLDVSATGLSSDAETRQLLEDSLRGVMAMWRLAAQEKSPELVSVLRKFSVSSDNESVSIRGTVPGSLLRYFAAHSHHRKTDSE